MEHLLGEFPTIARAGGLEAVLMTLALSTVRLATLALIFPLLTRIGLQPGLLHGGLVLGLSLPVLPVVAADIAAGGTPGPFTFVGLAAKEALIGSVLGLILGVPFWAAEAAGNYMDFQRGASIASIIDPGSGEQTTPLGTFLFLLFAGVFTRSGLFERGLLDALYGSYRVWPATSGWPRLDAVRAGEVLGLLQSMAELGFLLAGPLVFATLLLELGLAVVSRFAPQLNVFFLALSLKVLVTALLLPLYAATLVAYLGKSASPLLRALETARGFFR